MARIVYITNGMASTLNSSLEFSRRLASAGHEIVYISHVDLSESVERHGFQFVQLTDVNNIRHEFKSRFQTLRSSSFSLSRILGMLRFGISSRKRSLRSEEICNVVNELDAELLVVDFEMHYAILATRKLDLPTVLVGVWFSIFRSPGLPPMHTGLLPPDSFVERVRIEWEWWKLILPRLARPIAELHPRRLARMFVPVRYGTLDRHDLASVAKAHQCNLRNLTSRCHWSHPHVYTSLPMLSFNVREMELPHDTFPRLSYVGPMVHLDRRETRTSDEEYASWKSFHARVSGQSLIYCSLGTFKATNVNFLKRLVEVFRQRTEWSLVIGLGGKLEPQLLEPVPDNVLVMRYAPQLEVLKAADAAITHGGITSINECITFEVPVLVLDNGYIDQPGCAARVAVHRLGTRISPDTISNEALDMRLAEVLEAGDIRENVRKMRQTFLDYARQLRAEQAINRLLVTHRNATRL